MTGNTDLRTRHAGVVLVGHFNPLIFQPEWMERNDLIGPREAEAARSSTETILHSQMAIVPLSSSRLQVTLDRFEYVVVEAPLIRAKDFVLKCFRLLSHTPVSQMGINFVTVFRAGSRRDWDAFGDALAPKEHWSALLGSEATTRTGGLVAIAMERVMGDDRSTPSKRTVSIQANEPRTAMETTISVNDHYAFGVDSRAGEATEVLDNLWEDAERKSTIIADSLRGLCRAA
jgi:hypothetical protein